MRDVLAIILGGGQGSRLFPLTERRAKPAVPLGGKYRLIDIPISNCLHAEIRRIFILTQFNSASLNRHIGQTYRLDTFSRGFVEILAAEQTPDNPNWYQGTADAVRQAVRHFERHDADYYLILSGDHLYRMNYAEFVEDHVDRQADITVAALPVGVDDASAMGILRFDRTGQISGFEEKPSRDRLLEIGRSLPVGRVVRRPLVREAVCGLDGRLRVLARRAARHPGRRRRHRLRPRGHSGGARPVPGQRVPVPRLLGRRRHDSVLLRRQHPADQARRAVPLLRSRSGRSTRIRGFFRARGSPTASVKDAIVAEGCFIDRASSTQSVIGIRTRVQQRARASGDRCCSARTTTAATPRRRRSRAARSSASVGTSSSIG